MQPNRNGYVYTLDAKTGEYLKGFQYTDRLTWSSGLDENGRPIVNEDARPKKEPEKRFVLDSLEGTMRMDLRLQPTQKIDVCTDG